MKKAIVYILLIATGAFLWWAFSPLLFDEDVQDELDPEIEARLRMQEEADAKKTSGSEADINTEQNTTPRPAAGTGTFVQGPFEIQDTAGHPASGEIEVIHSQGEKLLRFNDYDGTNGPDLFVYLATDLEATDFINLGEAKGNKGTLIYGMPLDVDLSKYKYVLTWCKAFGVLFDYAEIN